MRGLSANSKRICIRRRCIGVVEIILILVVLISLVIIFKEQLTNLVQAILSKITKQSNSILDEERREPMEKKGQYYCFSGADLKSPAVTGCNEHSICAGSGSENTDSEQYGYWTLFSVWTV